MYTILAETLSEMNPEPVLEPDFDLSLCEVEVSG
jgi:hypothetical protein